jgi:hypothetical protein
MQTKQLTIHYDGKLVGVHFLTGNSKETIPHVRELMSGVPDKHAGLGGSAGSTTPTLMLTRRTSRRATSGATT